MRILYRDGQNLSLAQVTKVTCSGPLLICQLAALTPEGQPEMVIRPLPSPELCEEFFREVVCTTPADGVISLEHTNFNSRLGAMFNEFDALFDD